MIRNWRTPDFLGEKYAAAFQLNDNLSDLETRQTLLRGIPKDNRFKHQDSLAKIDMEYLGGYRRSLIDCQVKLFMIVLTTGVAIGSAYFGLSYHSDFIGQINNASLSFWRSMLAALPGLLAMGSSFMVAQKCISIQRIDAYISILNECFLSKRYPREYKGWESEYRKFKHVLNSEKCKKCPDRWCGKKYNHNYSLSRIFKIFTNPLPDMYQVVMFMSFFAVILLSVFAVVIELLKNPTDEPTKMFISAFIAVILTITIFVLIIIFINLRSGSYSVEYLRRTWCELLTKCKISSIQF
jgi:hypothetical protein